MKRLVGVLLVGIALMLHGTPSWGGGPPNPTSSDVNGNTAGGNGALSHVDDLGDQGGFNNTGFGDGALRLNATGDNNTATGSDALMVNTTGSDNTATGAFALESNSTGNANTATGYWALLHNQTGSFNTATGFQALGQNSTGTFNTATGIDALYNNTTGGSNTATGGEALENNTTGNDNTATGGAALFGNTTGSDNTATGVDALFGTTTGSKNTAAGVRALGANETGQKNTAFGYQALWHSTGSGNIAVGPEAGVLLESGNKNIYIGHSGVTLESKTMRLGSLQTRAFIAGVAGTGVTGSVVEIDANGQLGVALSSARYKRDIAAMGIRSEGLLQLRPVTFAYQDDPQRVTHFGLVAEEVATVYPDLVTRTAAGQVQAVRYQELIPMLVNELQRQQRELAALRNLVERLQATGIFAER